MGIVTFFEVLCVFFASCGSQGPGTVENTQVCLINGGQPLAQVYLSKQQLTD